MLEILNSSVCKLWQKRQIHINTDFAVTGWMLCVIPHIHKDARYHSYSDHRKQVNNVIKNYFMEYLRTKCLLLKKYSELNILNLITRMVNLIRIDLYRKAKTSEMVTVIYGIKHIHFLAPRFLFLLHV